MGLPLEWTKNLKTDQEKQDFESLLRNSTRVMSRLRSILDDWEKELTQREYAPNDYDSPAWGYKQAHRNGERSRIKKLKDLLSFLKG